MYESYDVAFREISIALVDGGLYLDCRESTGSSFLRLSTLVELEKSTGSVSVQVTQQNCQRASPSVVSEKGVGSVCPKMAQWAQKTGYLRPPGKEGAANTRYTTPDETKRTLSAIHAGTQGGKTGLADILRLLPQRKRQSSVKI